jgi:leucyl-tRNA synthetase
MSNSSESPSYRYTPQLAGEIENRWQNYWRDNGTFNAPNPVGDPR